MLHVEKSQGLNKIKHYDWFILILVVLLSAYGLVVIASVAKQLNKYELLVKQSVGIIAGAVAMVVLSLIDYKDLKVLGFPAYGFSILLLVLVLFIGRGKEETGTQGWFKIGPVSYQPSELGKITFILIVAFYLERIVTNTGKYNYIKLLIFSALPIFLVLLQPDIGTSMVYVFIFVCMVFFAGIPYKYIFISAGAGVISIIVIYITRLYERFPDYLKKRFYSFINKDADPLGANFQVRRSIQYTGAGQLWGRGWGKGMAAENVPYSWTDFIFSVVAEEFGFVGAAFLIILFLALFARCIYVAWCARDRYGSFVVMGVVSMFFAHFMENVGMNIGLLPVTGIPLPFISYGVSSVTTNFIAVGIVLSISLRKRRLMFE
ncbi:rod shape-determining protein RodA [Thermoclostridium stercorarium subsp. stercorarium DSM 8532]|jgi:rod shape determining protein RodA|uniref:Rod shape-determining protein RodA n=3 Tax=Thermoclostridium stercorarium TaxID=1510 RepID=L7VS39_THES1|nr:rod shape-determining protein RodA [Thermoclostridium stercorarium]AGC69151.1 rod shape-determining protein RodA [Thermoclostridium stercorarium subsp. stercorarium DSM 8532]AGI40120.1 RodA [Thermoclostridium stercorarium subsp. stercorarium DSM 8532]ANW99433.1 rod shape-determining protein RodA [Thermoclostridium stercorarium subsp. thermolacticum DSM 2910]ANX02059.1 rod shape-determining protein RodA [Thermoclostridium stercorarium subsp. leptospartum DSM 9219]UZQ85119.1 rod shape-determi